MKQVFAVTIHYHGDTTNEINVIAVDDLKAREAAIKDDAKDFSAQGFKAPRVEFCEIRLVCDAIVA